MKKIKVATIVGTRPEIIRLSRVISKLDEVCDHQLIHTGQNYDYELNEIFFDDLGIKKPNYFLDCAGKDAIETIGNTVSSSGKILNKIKPDAVLILGDTNSCLAAISAKRNKIPVFHMEAGNRCFDERVPEEINRKIVDHISDINLPYSDIAREYLLAEGISKEKIIKTGSPMFEVLNFYKEKIDKSKILKNLKLRKNEYFVVSAHREENIDSSKNFSNLIKSLNKLAEKYNFPIIFSTHPRTAKKISSSKIELNKRIHLMKPVGFFDYIKLQKNSFVTLSDSGTISEEASILGFLGLNIRDAHERPEAMEEASVIMTGTDETRILQSIELLKKPNVNTFNQVKDYSNPNVSDKVLRIIFSYIDYVNRTVWKNY